MTGIKNEAVTDVYRVSDTEKYLIPHKQSNTAYIKAIILDRVLGHQLFLMFQGERDRVSVHVRAHVWANGL